MAEGMALILGGEALLALGAFVAYRLLEREYALEETLLGAS